MLTDLPARALKLSTGLRRQLATLEPEGHGDDCGHDDECQAEVTRDPLRVLPLARQRREDRLHPKVVARVQEDRRPEVVVFNHQEPRQPISSPVGTAAPDSMLVVPVRTTNIAISTQLGAPPNPNPAAACRTKSVFGDPPNPKIQMPSEATRQ